MEKLNLTKNEILNILKTKKVLISLVTKNVINHIFKVLKLAVNYGSYFESFEILIIDGFSTDGTYEFCKEWVKLDKMNCKIYRQNSNFLPRPLSLSEARNMYISLFEEKFKKDTYLICMDCDEVNDIFCENGFLSNFDYDLSKWDMMGANQLSCYYDIYALRSEEFPWNYQDKIRETGDSYTYLTKMQIPKPRNHPLINVHSAFGGTVIYHTEKLKGCRYNSYKDGKELCEHIPFNFSLINNGGSLFINPNFIISN